MKYPEHLEPRREQPISPTDTLEEAWRSLRELQDRVNHLNKMVREEVSAADYKPTPNPATPEMLAVVDAAVVWFNGTSLFHTGKLAKAVSDYIESKESKS